MSAVLELQSLSAGYGSQPVVHDVDLRIDAGTVTVLLGPNGAGKTTVMRTISGIIPPLAGRIALDGADLVGPQHRRARQGIAFVAEERSVFARLTVDSNLRIAGKHASAALTIFPELQALMRRRGGDLSGGEQQMLTVARALSSRPRLLLVDELSLGLAPLIVDRLLRAVRAAADDGVAVLMVEQHAHKALAIADQASVLSRGRVVLDGTAKDLRGRMDEIEQSYLHGADEPNPGCTSTVRA